MGQSRHLAVSFVFAFLLSLVFASAIAIDNPNIPIVRIDPAEFPDNFTANISVDSARNWDTLDYGQLDQVNDINHNWLSGLQGGSSGEYYHLNSSVYTEILSNIYNWATATDVNNAVLWEVQSSNNSLVQLKTPRHINMSENDLYVRDIYASNETLYLGNSKLTGGTNGNIQIENGSMNATYYYGSGKFLTDLNLTDIIIDGGNITANYIEAINELVLDNELINNWSELPQYFVFGDTWNYVSNDAWYFNESKLNESIVEQALSQLSNYYNSSEIDANFIRWDNESDLNVNSSTYWNNINSINTTVLENNDGVLNIVMSFFYNLFYTKDEVDNSFVSTQGDSVINGTLNVTNLFADNIDVLNLTADQIYAIDIVAGTIDVVNMTVEDLSASTLFARNFTVNGTPEGFCLSDGTGCENITPNINGVGPWIITNGGNISFNETNLGFYTYNQSQIDNLISNISLTPGPQGEPGANGTDGANLTMDTIINNGDGTYTWNFSDGTSYTTGNLTGPQGIPGINGTNGTFTDILNNTQFTNSSNIWSLDLAWLTSFINSWFSGKTTDDLTEGTTNKYDNQSWNESRAIDLFEINLKTEITVIPIVAGTGTVTTANSIDFEIKEIDVSCDAGMKFRFEATETTSGDIIDKDRKQHTTNWIIEKNYPINDTVDLSITNTNPTTGNCTITIKYLDNLT